ncbi:sensor histidine kinase [Streptosporangium subroseum]|uniref:sensor histidine kinase n=1 Tax=Streptosporangium subroseum TaxID=106412 RepID=UPI00308A3E51|nr:histidine kinase [Streptosporangium subroseum]
MRGVPGRLSRLLDLGLWLVVCVPPVTAVVSLHGREVVTAAVGVPLLGAATALSRRRPLAALAVPVALSLTLDVQMFTPLYWTALVLFGYLAGQRMATARPALWFFAAVAVVGLPLCALVLHDLWGWPTQLLTLLLTVALPWLLGRYRRQYAELVGTGWRLADRLEREQQAVADRARIRERTRIAGDMHDSLGHDLTLIAVRAGALELDPTLDARQQAAVGELREAAGAATERLREIIGVLRADDEQPPRVPLAENAEALVERVRNSGVTITLERLGDTDDLPPMVGLAVHRVLQEALTNAAKHAPGTAVHVRLVRHGAILGLSVVNDPATVAPLPGVASGGSGLVGLDERVRLAGGTLRTGSTPEGGFEVVAELPVTDGATPRAATATRPTASARELAHARRQVRRRLVQTIVVPLAVLGGILLLMIPISFFSSSFSVLERDRYERLTVGDARGDVQPRLPTFTKDGPPDDAPPTPKGEDCVYYNTRTAPAAAYRLCFAHERLASKAIVGGSR